MARYELYVSVDIGSRSTKGAVIMRDGEKYTVLGYISVDSRGIENGDIKDVSSFKENMMYIMDELEKQFPKLGKSIFLFSFSTDRFLLSEHSEEDELAGEDEEDKLITEEMLDTLREKALERLSGSEHGYRVFHFYPKRFLIDEKRVVFNPVDMKAKKLTMEFIAVKADSSLAEPLKATIEDSLGVEISLFSSPIVAAEGVLTATEKDSGVVMVDLGHDFTTLVAYLNGIPIDLHVIPVGIRHVIKDIAYVLGTSIGEAETLLRNYGSALYESRQEEMFDIEYKALDGRTLKRVSVEKLSLIINARVREILNKARRIFKDLERNVPEYRENGIPGGIVLTGGGAKIKGITDIAGQVFRTNIRVGTFLRSITGEYPEIEGGEEVADDPLFSAVFGNILEFDKAAGEGRFSRKKKRNLVDTIIKFFKSLIG